MEAAQDGMESGYDMQVICFLTKWKCDASEGKIQKGKYMRLNEFEQDLEETASVGRGSPVQQELEDSETEASDWFLEFFLLVLREVVKKKRYFYGQADRKGGRGGSAPLALTVSKCENFGPIYSIIKW